MVVPHSSSLVLCVNILDELWDMSPSVSIFGLEILRKFRVKVILDGFLCVQLDGFYLSGVPLVDGRHGQ